MLCELTFNQSVLQFSPTSINEDVVHDGAEPSCEVALLCKILLSAKCSHYGLPKQFFCILPVSGQFYCISP